MEGLLSKYQDHEIKKILKSIELKPYTQNTITDPEILLNEIILARERGWAVDNQELQPSIRCIAAPIYDYRNEIIAAISISAPVNILPPEMDEENAKKVVDTAMTISSRLGYVKDRF